MKRTSGARGVTLLELLMLIAVIGIVLSTSVRVVFRSWTSGPDLVAEMQALQAAERVVETVRATGKLPDAGALAGYSAVMAQARALRIEASAQAYGGAGLQKLLVRARWRSGLGRTRELKLVTLVRR